MSDKSMTSSYDSMNSNFMNKSIVENYVQNYIPYELP